ncbi:hypothetical protein ACIRP7_15045, partial [Streptomyces sp. NPDC102270]
EQRGPRLDRTQAAAAALGPQPAAARRPRASSERAVRGRLAEGGPMTLALRVPKELPTQVPAEQRGTGLDRTQAAAAALGPQPAAARRPRASSERPPSGRYAASSLREGR